MIFTESTIKISNNVSKMDSTIVLYRGDKNVEIRFTILQSPFKYSNTVATNVIESTNASYGQLVIKTPNDKPPIFSDVSATKEGTVLFTITKEMIDEIEEVGVYTFQIRLMDENKQSRVTIPPVENGIEIKEPIAIEDDNTTNVVGLAKANYAVATLSDVDTPAFDDNGKYNKTNWNDGDLITNTSLNKIEEGIYTTNENVTATKKYVDDIKAGLGAAQLTTIEPQLIDMPRIYFSEGTLPTSKTATIMKFDYYSKSAEYHGYVDIKCQGNSSMAYNKKNFTIKPYKDKAKTEKLKINFKGWGKQSKFVLKANWIDITHARNVVSARLWGDIIKTRSDYATALPELLRTSPNQGAIDGFPVLVYSNGVYQGRYTLNIPKDKWMSNMDDALDTHCILCGENYQSGCFRALPNINGSDWTDELHDVVPATIKTSWTNAIKFVMNSSDAEFKTNLSNYFDVNSLIDYLLYGIVSTNLDGFGKNQLFFTYDGVHWIASVYDLDSTWGLWWNGSKFVATDYAREQFQDMTKASDCSGEGNLLYLRVQKLFLTELKTRYAELRKEVLSASHIIQKFEEFNQVCPKDIVQEDYASTTGGGKFTGIPSTTTNNIQQLRSYIVARLTYVDSYINALQEAVPCTNIALDKTELQFTSLSIPDQVIDITKNTSAGCLIRGDALINNAGAFGDIKSTTSDTTTDFIPFTSNNTLVITQPYSRYGCGVVAYNSDKKAISCYNANNNWDIGTTNHTIDITDTSVTVTEPPKDTAYIRLCFNLTNLSNVVVTKKYSSSRQQLTPALTPTNTTDTVVWSVSPTGFATVDNGVVTPIKNGTCVITATCGSHSATCNVTVNLPSVACTSIALDKTALQLGTIEGTTPDTETNLIEGLTWKDGQLNDSTGALGTGTDKCVTNIQIPATGLYTFSVNANYTYLKMFLFNSNGQLIQSDNTMVHSGFALLCVYEPNCYMSISLFPNSLDFNANNVTLKYVHNLANTPNKDVDIQAATIANPSLLSTSGDYKIIELYADKVYNEVAALKLGSTIYKIYNGTTTNLTKGDANKTITRTNNGYCTKGEYNKKSFFNVAVPSTWGTTKEDIANYIQTNNIAVVMNPSEYLNSADKIGSTIINSYQLKPTIQPSNTTDVVEWSVSPEGIATVNNGLVKAVSNGETVITATCGTKSATCNVTVSNLVNEPTINYELAEPLVCDGTSTYKDTNIKLLSSDNINKDWTMLIEFTPAQLPISGYNSIVHCMNEDSPFPGMNIDINNDNRRVTLPNNNVIDKGLVVINKPIYYALVKQGKLFTLYDNIGTVLGSVEPTNDIISVNQTLLLGAYQDTSGNKGRYFNGTINKFKLIEGIYTVPQIKQYFGVAENPIAYSLPKERTFNGTSDYVDTGIQLFKTDQNFTITMDVTADTKSTETALIHCMKEESPYPGIVIQKGGESYYSLSAGNNKSGVRNLVPIGQRTKVVIVKNGTTMKVYNDNGVIDKSVYEFTSINQTLLLGAYQTVDGTKGRYFKGTIHQFGISDTVYTLEQINAYLGIVSQGRVFKIDSTCMNTTGNKLTDSIGGIEATLSGAPTISNNQIVFTENNNFSFDITSLKLATKNRTLRVKFTPTTLDDTTKCVCTIGASATSWGQQTSSYITNTNLIIQHGGSGINNITVGDTTGGDDSNRLPNVPSINTEYEIVISENASTNKIRWFVNGTLAQDGTTTLHNPLFLANTEGSGRFIGSYSLIEIYDTFCDTYEDFNNIAK